MKTTPITLLITLFFIANSAVEVRASSAFSSKIPAPQASSSTADSTAKKPKKVKKAKAKKGGGVAFMDGSAESRLERDKRLVRECKGRPNSGACEGYAQP